MKISRVFITANLLAINILSATAQPTLSGSTICIGSVLTVSSTPQPIQIIWLLGGVGTSTVAPTYAANGITVAGGHGSGSGVNQLSNPNGVYVDGNGNVYVDDYNNNRIQEWAPGATSGVTVAGGNGSGSAANQLHNPQAVCVDGSGNVFIADYGNNRVQKWAPGATTGTTVAGGNGLGNAANQLNQPSGVCLDGSGNIYIADAGNNRIQEWAPGASTGTTVAGGNGAGSGANQLNYPTGVFVDGSGNVYATDQNNNRVQKWLFGATTGTTAAGGNGAGSGANQLNSPNSAYVDIIGNVYVADPTNSRVQKWFSGATSGVTIAGVGGSGTGASQLKFPGSVYLDGSGNVYVADYSNNRVQEFTASIVNTFTASAAGNYTASVTTVAGTATTNTTSVTANPAPSAAFTAIPNPVCLATPVVFASGAPLCSGNALSFNGSSSQASKGSVMTTAVNNITMEAWVNWAGGTAAYQFILLNGNSSLDGYSLIIPPGGGNLIVLLGNVGFLNSSVSLTTGVWHHVAYVRNAGISSIYVDGTQYSLTSSSAAPNTPTTAFRVGHSQVSTEGFNGSIDEVKFWGTARSTVQIQADMTACNASPQAGLLGYWKFDEGTGTTAADASGNGNTLTLSNTTWLAATETLSTYAWNFGDAASSSVNNVSHTYASAGVYSPSLTVTNSYGCTATTTTSVTVNAAPTTITGSPTVLCLSGGTATTTLSEASTGGTWSSSVSGVATIALSGRVVTSGSIGTTTIKYDNGCGTPATQVITVNAPPIAIIGNALLCAGGLTIQLSDNGSPNGTWSSSNAAVASVGSTTGVVTPGVIQSTTTINYSNICGSATSITATVNATPAAITGNAQMCTGSSKITLANTSTNGTWSGGTGGVATLNAGTSLTATVTPGATQGTTTITYSNGCGSAASITATVNASPASITGNAQMCASGSTITLANTSTNGTWSSSTTTVATVNLVSGLMTSGTDGNATINYSNGCGTASVTATVTGLPIVTNVSPLVGYPTSAVTITGTNFNASTTNDIVYFGATRASVIAATANALSVTVPTGATFNAVSVDNAVCALTGYSDNFFLPTYNNSAYIPGTVNFDPKVEFNTGSNPEGVVLADVNGDGKADIVVANAGANSISVLLNASTSGSITTGSFAASVDFSTGGNPNCLSVGDIDGDGKPDVVIANYQDNSISVLRNISTGGAVLFAGKVDFNVGAGPVDVAIVDIDGDGKPEIVSTNVSGNSISVLHNTATSGTITSGSFAAKVDFSTGFHPARITSADIDEDGKPEIIVSNQNANTISVFHNIAASGTITSGSLAAKVDFTTGSGPYSVAVVDVDGDGKPEIVVSNYDDATLSVFRNMTTTPGSLTSGSLAPKVDFATGYSPNGIAVGDFDGDGKPDIAVTNRDSYTVSVLRNTATSGSITAASLSASVEFGTSYDPIGMAAGDLDGDGKADMVVANYSSNTVSVLHNQPMLPMALPVAAIICDGTTVSFSDATPNGIWSSSNTTIATVNTNGHVTGVSVGTAIISYALPGGSLTATVTVNPLPAIHTFTGGGAYCALDSGVHVGLTLSEAGISYQLYNGAVLDTTVAGTGSAIDFGLYTTPGIYHAIATNTVTLCTNYLSGITISINPLPDTFTVTGGGSYCEAGSGVSVGLDSSVSGINYQLYNGSSPTGASKPGTGHPLDFGLQTGAGVYTVIASDAITMCPEAMAGSATVTIIPLPTADTMTGGGGYCASDSGVHVGLNNSTAGIIYQLYTGGIPVGTPDTSIGGPLDLGLQTAGGAYVVVATDPATNCSNIMAGIDTVTVNPLPDTFAITGGGSYCADGNGVHVGLISSDPGIRYQLYNGAAAAGSALNGTGSSLDFGLIIAAGVYKVVATDTTTHCMNAKNDSTTVTITPMAVTHLQINTGETAGDTVCGGGPVTFTAQTINGGTTPHYQWAVNNLNVGTNDSTYTYRPAPFDVIAATMISSAACAIPDTLHDTMTVQIQTPMVPSVFILVTPINTIHLGQPDTLIAVPTNCGYAPRYQWYKNGNLIAGATNAMYTSSTFANHDSMSVRVLTNGACGGQVTENSEIIHVYPAGIVQINAGSDIRLFPNPNEGSFRISGTLSTPYDGNVSIEITDMLGQVIYKNTVMAKSGAINAQIQLGNTLANGMYLLNLRSETEIYVFHFVVGR